MPSIAFFEVEPWEQDYLQNQLKQFCSKFVDCNMLFFDKPLTAESLPLIRNIDTLAVFVNSRVTPEIISALPNLKAIATMSTGFDHIDLKAASQRGITVSSVPSYGENTVAEHAMALLLNISRKIFDSVERTRKGNWNLQGLRGFDLKGKTLGILGTGRIGKNVAHYAQAFGMKVIAYDKFPNPDWAKECGITYLNLDEVLAQGDVLTLHLPAMKETEHVINLQNIGKIKKGCIIINTARGALIETHALLKGLQNGTFAAAGLDVLEEEGIVKEDRQLLSDAFQKEANLKILLEDHILQEQDNVYITPHNAFNSPEALQRILDTTVQNIIGFWNKQPVNVVK